MLLGLAGRFGKALIRTLFVGVEGELPLGEPFRCQRVARSGGAAAALGAGAAAAAEAGDVDVCLLLSPRAASFAASDLELVDAAALSIVAATDGAAGLRAELDGDAPLAEGLLALSADLARRRRANLSAAESWSDLEQRVRNAGRPLYDFRSLRALVDAGLRAPALPRGLGAGLTRALARLAGFGQEVDPRFKLDDKRLPWLARHGEPIPVAVSGWIAFLPQVRELELRIGRGAAQRARSLAVEVPRPDVLLGFPDLADDRCGFQFEGELAPMPLGVHDVVLAAVPGRAERRLGAVRVLPQLSIVADRCQAPSTFGRERGLALLVEGRVIASHPPIRLEATLDDQPVAIEQLAVESTPGAERPSQVAFRVVDRVARVSEASRHELRVRAFDARGKSASESFEVESAPGEPIELVIAAGLGARDPRNGRALLTISGSWFDAPREARVEVDVDGVGVAQAPISIAPGARLAIGSFGVECSPRVQEGERELTLRFFAGSGATPVATRTLVLGPQELEAELVVERAELTSADDERRATLRVEGEIVHANLIDAIRITIDGRHLVDVDPRSFTVVPGDPGIERRRFLHVQSVAAERGGHQLRVELVRSGKELARWTSELEPIASLPSLTLASPALDALRRGSPAPIWSRLRIAGELRGAPPGAEIVLDLDGVEAARARPGSGGRFDLALHLEPGPRSGALEIVDGARCLAKLPPFELLVRRLTIPPGWTAPLDRLRTDAAGPFARLGDAPSAELLRAMGEQELGALADFAVTLAELAAEVDAATRTPATIVDSPPAPLERRLRALFFTWEIPWSGHGGGVSLVNWLSHLGARHDLTLIHPVHAGGEGLSDEVRSCAREILAIPRDWHAVGEPRPVGVPEGLLRTFTPALRGALAAELAGGEYDLFNAEFAGGSLHLVPTATPSLLVHHEVGSFARAAEAPESFESIEAAARWLMEFVPALRYDTRLLDRCDLLATLTEPEARFLAPFLPGAELHVNPIPIDLDAYRLATRSATPLRDPLFVFVGTYRHPPNRAAAERLIDRIAPRLRARLPRARIALVGVGLPPELVERARANGVDCEGFVADLTGLYATATATLAPIATGGGMRVKLLEAMACGCPVVTTALGMNGIAARSGTEFLHAETDAEFVEAAALLAQNPALGETLSARGRTMIEREHSIAAQGERREGIWAATIAAARARRG